jgi:hypothetical protein
VDSGNGTSKQTKRELDVLIGEMNAQALADNLAELRTHYDERLRALENEVASLRILVQNQSRVIGEALQRVMGTGSTERGE